MYSSIASRMASRFVLARVNRNRIKRFVRDLNCCFHDSMIRLFHVLLLPPPVTHASSRDKSNLFAPPPRSTIGTSVQSCLLIFLI